MRWRWLGILCGAVIAGCSVTAPERSTSFMKREASTVLGDKVAHLVIAVIEQPVGELFINKELWEHSDQQLVELETQIKLDTNGFRVGQLVGSPPQRLQELLQSERWCAARRRVVQSGYAFVQPISKVRPHLSFTIEENGKKVEQSLADAECQFEITPTLLPGGATRIRFTPRVQYGQVAPRYKSSDKGWSMEIKKPGKLYPQAAWEITVDANDTLLIGALLDRQDSLGFHAFVEDNLNPTQRLLVIRAGGSGETDTLTTPSETGPSPPLARQATMNTIRASQP